MSAGHAAAAAAFADTLARLEVPVPRDAGALGRRAALLTAAEAVWSRHLGPMLESREVQELLGVSRQAVSDFHRRRRLLALRGEDGRVRFPAFQFGRGGVRKAVAEVLAVLAAAELSPHTLASWWKTPQRALDGTTPAVWLARGQDAKRVVEAAHRSAARFGH